MNISRKKSKTEDLMILWGHLECLKQKTRDVLAFIYEDKVYVCNARRKEMPFVIDDKPVTMGDFLKLQTEIGEELERRGVVITVRNKDANRK